MRQLSKIISIFISLLFCSQIAYSAMRGGVEYTIPIDYSKLSPTELELKAHESFYLAQKYKDGILSEEMTKALNIYEILEHIHPEKSIYCIKQGVLYSKLGKDRFAKGAFSKAISTEKNNLEAYYEFGNFYYKREYYRKALKYYNEAYKLGMTSNYDMLEKMGDIYEKLGDTRSALKYLNLAKEQSPNENLANQILRIESSDAINKEFYSNTRIHKQ